MQKHIKFILFYFNIKKLAPECVQGHDGLNTRAAVHHHLVGAKQSHHRITICKLKYKARYDIH
jgi:hypothetical protein